MKNLKTSIIFSIISVFVFTGSSFALDWTYSYDSYSDASGGNGYEVYRMGYAFDDDYLYFNMLTGFNLDRSGLSGIDKLVQSGDLYINVGGSHNLGTGSVFGLALTSHSGDMNTDMAAYDSTYRAGGNADNGYDWAAVTAGHLYSNVTFATGVYEGYAGANELSEDGGKDPFGYENNIPTHIAEFGADLGWQGDSSWNNIGRTAVNAANTVYRDNVYEVNARISLDALGVEAGESVELWWSMECGNDTFSIDPTTPNRPPVATPEPGTLLLLGLGLLGIVGFAKKRQK